MILPPPCSSLFPTRRSSDLPCSVPTVLNGSWQPYTAAGKTSLHTLAQELSGPPTTVRQFTPSDVLTFYAEAYDNRSAKKCVREGSMVVTTTVYNAQDAVVQRTVDDRPSPAPAGGNTTYPIRSSLPLTGLAPGGYVLEVAVTRHGVTDPSVARRIPFEVRRALYKSW